MANQRQEILTMNDAVQRLSANERQDRHFDMDDRRQEDDYDYTPPERMNNDTDFDDDERLILGQDYGRPSGDESVVELRDMDGNVVRVPASQLADQNRLPPNPAPQMPSPPPGQPAGPDPQVSARLQKLDGIINELEGRQDTGPKLPSPQLMEEDPDAYHRALARYNHDMMAQADNQRKLDQAKQERDRELAAQQQQYQQSEQARLGGAWREWGDLTTRPRVVAQVERFAQTQGFSPEEARMIANGQVDHRLTLMVRDAMKGEILDRDPKKRRSNQAPKVGNSGPRRGESGRRSANRDSFLRRAEREGVTLRGAADFLAGKFSR